MNGRNFDVGLHPDEFYSQRDQEGALAKLLRQLRFRWEEFQLAPQVGSLIAFPGVELRFNNDLELLRSEIAKKFPSQRDAFESLLKQLIDYDDLKQEDFELSSRKVWERSFPSHC